LAPTARPSVVDSLAEIGSTPQWLGVFLALLGLGGLAHALVSGGRRSRRDLAVARALGLRPRQAASAVRWGAALTTLVGVAAGMLIGLVVGRVVWRHVVAGVGAVLETQVSAAALVLVPLAALSVSLLVAIVPGRRAASMRPGAILRAE
jgi:ABC-type lipoprotein release transport system permease subunit